MTVAKGFQYHNSLEIENANRSDGIGRKSARGGISSIVSSFSKAVIQLFITAILSRLLSIADYGIVAMSSAVIAIFALFGDMGLGSATTREERVEHGSVSTLFWLSNSLGWVVFLACCALAPIAGAFYHESRLAPVIIVSALAIPFASLGSQHQAILMRQARWTEINVIAIMSQCLGGVLAIVAAWQFSVGYWALAIQSVSATGFNTLGYWLRCRWYPGRPAEWRAASASVSFGGYLMLFNAVNYIHRQMDNVIVGRELGPVELGFYSRGYNLFLLPLTVVVWPIANVITPLLARQKDPARFATIYSSALAAVYLPAAVFAGGLFLFTNEAVSILYGYKWLPSASVLQILAISLLVQPLYTSGGWIEISLGRTKRHFYASLFAVSVYLVSFLIGVGYGIEGMAKAYLIANSIVVGPWIWFCTRRTSITFSAIFESIRSTLLALIIALLITEIMGMYLPGGATGILLKALTYVGTYLLACILFWNIDRSWNVLIKFAFEKLKSNR